MNKIQRPQYLLLAVVCLALSLFSCKKEKKDSMASMKLPIEVGYPKVENITLTTEYPGYLQALQTADLVARVSGQLKEIHYSPGDFVKKGQLLFVIEPTTYEDNLKQAQAALREGKSSLAYMQATYIRTKEAAKANAVAEIQVIEAQSNYEQALAAIKNFEAQVQTAKTNLSYCYVKAPFKGRVTKNVYDVGNYLNGNSAPTLATIYQDDKMYVNFSASDNQYIGMAIKQSQNQEQGALELTVIPKNQDTQKQFTAKLDYFAPNIDLSTGTINMRGIIDNSEGLLRDGLYVKVILPYSSQKDAILIPDVSIGTDQLGRYVYIVNDSSEVVYRSVEVGQTVNGIYKQILSGVTAKERFVTQALLKVRPGMVINPLSKDEYNEFMKKAAMEAKESNKK